MSENEKAQQRAMNAETRRRLLAQGSDPSHPHELVNVFYVFTEADTSRLIQALQGHGFGEPRLEKVPEREGDYWEVEASALRQPTVSELDAMTDQCVELAAQFDAEYDGWYTQPA